MNEFNHRTFILRSILCIVEGIFNRKARDLVCDREPRSCPPVLLVLHQLVRVPAQGKSKVRGRRVGRWTERGTERAALRREEEEEESWWRLPRAGLEPQIHPECSL